MFILSAYLASCVALDPGTAISRCTPTYTQTFSTQQECANSAYAVMQDKSQKAICVKK
jgi:hypothetical protein